MIIPLIGNNSMSIDDDSIDETAVSPSLIIYRLS